MLNELVDAAPDRGDLWMMRFETLRSLGLKTDFAHYLKQACINPVVQRKLDGPSLRQMWREVARDEPLPSDVRLPDDNLQSSAVVVRRRRFADTALRIAWPQLANPEVELVYTEPAPSGTTPWHPAGRVAPFNSAMREHAALRASHRLIYVPASDGDARNAQRDARLLENATLSLEHARALAFAGLLAAHGSAPRDFVVLAA